MRWFFLSALSGWYQRNIIRYVFRTICMWPLFIHFTDNISHTGSKSQGTLQKQRKGGDCGSQERKKSSKNPVYTLRGKAAPSSKYVLWHHVRYLLMLSICIKWRTATQQHRQQACSETWMLSVLLGFLGICTVCCWRFGDTCYCHLQGRSRVNDCLLCNGEKEVSTKPWELHQVISLTHSNGCVGNDALIWHSTRFEIIKQMVVSYWQR